MSRVETKLVEFGYLATPGWDLHTGSGPRSFESGEIVFDRPFHEVPPDIALCLAGIDSDSSKNLRVRLAPTAIDYTKFKITIYTWDDSILYGVWVTWIAVGVEF